MAWLTRARVRALAILALLLAVFAVSRFVKIMDMPVFTDEAIYIRWAQIGARDPAWRLISLTDGKQPMFTWLMMAMMRFVHDPLLAGRMVSLCAGAASMIGLFVFGEVMFGSSAVGLVAAAAYLVSPFALVYDRMALYDGLVATFYIWNTMLTVLLVRTLRLDVALILGLGLGAAMLNKTSGFLSLYLLPVALVLLFDWRQSERWKKVVRFVFLAVVAAGLSQVCYAVLRLSPFLYIITQKDALFVYPFHEWIRHPLEFLGGNLHGLLDWYTHYVTWPFVAVGVFSLLLPRSGWLKRLMLASYFAIPVVGLALFGRVLYPRYILFMCMPWYLLVSEWIVWVWQRIPRKAVALGIVCIAFAPSVWMSAAILRDIRTAPLAQSDLNQYVNDWPAGWGVKESVAYLREKAKTEKILVYTEGTFGLMPFSLEMYLADNPNVTIKALWPFPSAMTDGMRKESEGKDVYLVMYQSQKDPTWSRAEKILTVAEGTSTVSHLRLYRIHDPEQL